MIDFLVSRSSLELTGKDKKVIQKKAGEVYKLFNFFFGSGKLMGRFITKKSYVVCPFSHRFWENAFLNKEINSSVKFYIFNFIFWHSKNFFKVKLQGFFNDGSTSHGGQGEIFFRCTKGFLDFIKSIPDVFRNKLVVINRRRFGNYRYAFDRIALTFSSPSEKLVFNAVNVWFNPKDDAITVRALSDNGNLLSVFNRLAWGSPRDNVSAHKANLCAAVRTFPEKAKHWG